VQCRPRVGGCGEDQTTSREGIPAALIIIRSKLGMAGGCNGKSGRLGGRGAGRV
jgi:hypothetical protein